MLLHLNDKLRIKFKFHQNFLRNRSHSNSSELESESNFMKFGRIPEIDIVSVSLSSIETGSKTSPLIFDSSSQLSELLEMFISKQY